MAQAAHYSEGQVNTSQRFTRDHRCPICGGGDDDPRIRCYGYLSPDGRYAHCSQVPIPGVKPTPLLYFIEREKERRRKP
jgi:hypothetical protein